MNRLWNMVLLIAGLIILDQVTKGSIQSNFAHGESIPIIEGFFNFTYVRNPGAAFGFLANSEPWLRTPLFLYVPLIACFWLAWLIWTTRHTFMLQCLSYSLILAGAVGNLIDRFSLDYVVDFLDFHIGSSHFPAFNVADSSISIGAALLMLDLFINQPPKKEDKPSQEES